MEYIACLTAITHSQATIEVNVVLRGQVLISEGLWPRNTVLALLNARESCIRYVR